MSPKPAESLIDNLRVLAMEVGMHLDIAGAHIDLGTVLVDAVIVCLFPVVGTSLTIGGSTVIGGGESGESQFQTLFAFLVPLEMTNDVILFAQDLSLAGFIVAMKMLTKCLLTTKSILALQIRGHLAQIL